jgi:excisionase family DNA binding protein
MIENDTTAKAMYSVPEVAKRLGLGRAKVYELTNSGLLPSARIGNTIHVTHYALEAFLQALSVSGAQHRIALK